MTTPDTPRDDTAPLADQVFEEHPTTTWAPAPAPAATGTATADRSAGHPSAAAPGPTPPAREYVKGPAPFAVVLGLLGLVVAAATLFTEVVGIDVPWDDLGPWSVVGAGVLVLLVGGLGLRASRSQD